MVIRANIEALNSYRSLSSIGEEISIANRRLASGQRIIFAVDDAAGLAISESMRAQIWGLNRATRNVQEAVALINTADATIASIREMIIKMREIIIKAANDNYIIESGYVGNTTRALAQEEINHLIREIDAISARAEFNTMPLFSRRNSRSISFVSSAAQGVQPHNAPVRPANPTVINAGNIASQNGWSFSADNVLTISGGGDFRIDGAGLTIDRIVITGTAETNLILNGVNISTSTGAALDMRGANVNLWLDGNNVLDASGTFVHAGIQTAGGTLTINGTGTLDAIGGFQGAGIGGGTDVDGFFGEDGGHVTILGGTIRAVGGMGAGIGGGGGVVAGGGGGNIYIYGGIVSARSNFAGASIGGGGSMGAGGNLTIRGGVVEIADDQWIGGGLWNEDTGTLEMQGGNLSINPVNIRSGVTHFGQNAFRVQVTLEDSNGNVVPFGAHREVTYTINGLTINAITDSSGNLFMYLPVSFAGREGAMEFNGRNFRAELAMNENHGNRLVLTRNIGLPPAAPPRKGGIFHIQVGANARQSVFLHMIPMDSELLGFRNGNEIRVNILDRIGMEFAPILNLMDDSLDFVGKERARLGALGQRFGHIADNLLISHENLSESEFRIRDADMAAEMFRLTQAIAMRQVVTTVLSQNIKSPDMVLNLIRPDYPEPVSGLIPYSTAFGTSDADDSKLIPRSGFSFNDFRTAAAIGSMPIPSLSPSSITSRTPAAISFRSIMSLRSPQSPPAHWLSFISNMNA